MATKAAQSSLLGIRRSVLPATRQPLTFRLSQSFFSSASANGQLQRPINKNISFFSQRLPSGSIKPPPRIQTISRPYSNGKYFTPSSSTSINRLLWTIISLNTAVFSTWFYANNPFNNKLKIFLYKNFTLKSSDIKEGRYHTLLTSAFSHMELGHFVFNMVGLNAFGSVIKMIPGVRTVHVMGLVVGSALASSVAFLYHNSSSTTRTSRPLSNWNWKTQTQTQTIKTALGASGVVMGLAATATCLAPMSGMMIFPLPFAMPLFVLTGAYVGLDYYYLDSGKTRTGHAAHLGGFAFGTVFYLAYLRRFGGVWRIISRGR